MRNYYLGPYRIETAIKNKNVLCRRTMIVRQAHRLNLGALS
jgi:hypothetical protein